MRGVPQLEIDELSCHEHDAVPAAGGETQNIGKVIINLCNGTPFLVPTMATRDLV